MCVDCIPGSEWCAVVGFLNRKWTFGFEERREISLPVERLPSSQGLYAGLGE